MLRKVLCLVLSVFCVVAFVGCGGKSASSTKEKKLEVMASFYPSGGRKPCDGEYHDS